MKIVLSILILVAVLACQPDQREKPTTVPNGAIWKGSADGGCWILFGSITNSSVEATIFDENGELWDRGIFKKYGNCQIPKEAFVEKIVGFDGENLITNKHCSFKR